MERYSTMLKLIYRYRYISVDYAIIGSDNGLWHVLCQAITWANAGLLFIGLSGANFSDISIQMWRF